MMQNATPPIPSDDDLLAIGSAELKRILPLSRSTLYSRLKTGELPIVRLGKRVFLRRGDVLAYVAARVK